MIWKIAAAFFHNSAPKKMAQQGGEDIPGVPHKIALKKRRLNLGVFFAVVFAFFKVKMGRDFGDRQEPRF